MLTKLTIRNFKRFNEVEIELGNPVVFIGPNNSGKTTALQALTLWDLGIKKWNDKKASKESAEFKRPGVAVNRKDIITAPIPFSNLLWKNQKVQTGSGSDQKKIYIEIIVEGISNKGNWACGMQFYNNNEESFYCRPLERTLPEEAIDLRMSFLHPMSGLSLDEPRLDEGRIDVLMGEGRTAEVIRNLCYQIANDQSDLGKNGWNSLYKQMDDLFSIKIEKPEYFAGRGELTMSYRESSGVKLDLSASGRGFQQTLLLVAFMIRHPGSVLLLDEPDAHLEVIRQRDIYRQLSEIAHDFGNQIIIASHSETILDEAAGRDDDKIISFVGKPHSIDDRGSQLRKSLRDIRLDQYVLAEQMGWILYLEGSTDLDILKAFAEKLKHKVKNHLERPFTCYVGNQPSKARDHFFGLKDAKRDLVGFALFENVPNNKLESIPELHMTCWSRREIENYIAQPETLVAWAKSFSDTHVGPLFQADTQNVMKACISEIVPPVALRDINDQWWSTMKASDDYLDRVFKLFSDKTNNAMVMRKSEYHKLVPYVPIEQIDTEILNVLDNICTVAMQAMPVIETEL